VKIDCHIHTYRSGDCRVPVTRMLEAARDAGIDVVCITDHGTIDGALEATEVARRDAKTATGWPAVVVGQECRTWAGEIIGLFLSSRIPGNLQPEEVVSEIKAQGGIVYIPHPFCPHHNGLRRQVLEDLVERGLVDVIEVHNAKAEAKANDAAGDFAKDHSLVGAAASDAHYPEFVGRAFVEVDSGDVDRIAAKPKEFLAAISMGRLRRGTYTYAEAEWPKRV
jgi:predicted metal-dependent phosphoesterase TrpH